MKIEITQKTYKEIDLEFPLFLSHGFSLYKIISEDHWIEVENDDSDSKVSIGVFKKKPCWYGNVIGNGRTITEAEFQQAFDSAIKVIGSPASDSIEENLPIHKILNY